MDIRDLGGSKLEQTFVAAEQPHVCTGCASAVNIGDRFCQECGTRIGTNRSKRTTVKDKTEPVEFEPGSASIICINCGTTNKALSTVCGDCKIPLIPAARRRREDTLTGEQAGLRGSLTTRNRKPNFKATQNAISSNPTKNAVSTVSNQSPATAVSNPSATTPVSNPSSAAALNSAATTAFAKGAPLPISDAYAAHREKTAIEKNDATAIEKGQANAPVPKKTKVKQRLPGFISPVFKRQNLSDDTSESGAALDYLFAESNQSDPASLNHFDRLIAETRSMGSAFSLSTGLYTIESFFERIPIPLLFLILSFVLICVTAHATTQWNRYEQRLRAIDKIAINAEEDMRSFQLDKVIGTMQELEKTEKGDLPPRARAVLDQSLWLRSYSFAKQHEYAKAIADLSFVSANFVSFEDVVEKLAEYKKLLAGHPEFASPKTMAEATKPDSNARKEAGRKTAASVSKPEIEMVSSQLHDESAVSNKPFKNKLKPMDSGFAVSERGSAVSGKGSAGLANDSAGLEKRSPGSEKVQLETTKQRVPTKDSLEAPVSGTSNKHAKIEKDKRSAKSQAALLDREMKRYSNLLVEYFSKAESGQGDLAEPPSYEEWTSAGKRDF
ncbi:MAG: zinc ribbon domain-containing protein [Candidatus Melainabacteria bacterium]|nr:zinc ribbon domain-containing protein [Candidatus Melainabacteria bacterium]